MKRSEAIKIIEDSLEIMEGHDASEISAYWLLDILEDRLRMLPPEIFFGCGKSSNAWEPEDE